MSARHTTHSNVIDINLLPRSMRPREVSARTLVIAAALTIAVTALLPMIMTAHNERSLAADIEARAEATDRALQARQVDLTAHRALSEQLAQAQSKLAQIDARRAKLAGGKRPLVDDLRALLAASAAVPGIRIESVGAGTGGLRVDGVAPAPLDALAFSQSLTRVAGFPNAVLSTFAPAAAGAGSFTIAVQR